ncbi:sigma-54-dependent Fis family transcriptional regulator [Pseudomonas protegens]|jgi:two-component system C4-dicarboxylate transport response regulator DctD|uniref:C4-dicarboxylate transport transcriptional regulatory protein DctD n=4 Tax=Pseudomonas TaxID=286 RepID=Q4K799_PSEF5|nr:MULTISPECIES: sigma-54 dependent transcriptional regulator [Pseudomonas]GED75053.1 Fis family transcriptional regulator [Pseudomonas fluorescens]AAY94033.1 C4-dicarboxylate transport transcriptional regulatory protein DctD [Pseudomonas protegens Pf-5]AGL86533.1 C4-dicarboxylate transport transcriptional regulatory protein DctD [Pseudomonas protegens CHA0]APC22082.1 DNA-binding response regulator [Pseudomonas protegens]AQT11649.1 C4-dicarboxylate transport transcriptional regulatory protein 
MLNSVIVVDDEASIRTAVEQWLSLSGFEVQLFSRAEDCLAQLPKNFPGVILSDVRMPGISGLELLAQVQRLDPDLPIILLTGHGDVPMAVEAMRDGAYDFLEKPFSPDTLLSSLRRALDKRRLVLENRRLHQQADSRAKLDATLLGVSRALQTLRRQVLELAALPVNVLIRGETGSGKELIARCLHDFGPRAGKPFVALNCAAIPEQLFEAELFGHESGAFTGAQGKRIGKLEYADGGTLFLDEIESMPLAQQVKLLRVLQEQKLERLGSNQSIKVDLRIIAATKPDLLDEARAGRFREDLAYRLTVAELRLPPLRERREDIPLLYEHFAQNAGERLGRSVAPLSGAQLSRLLSHDWPGNVRELANAAERQVLGLGEPEPDAIEPGQSLAAQQEAFEAQCLRAALSRHKGDIKAVLNELQLPRRTLNEKMQRHGLTREQFLKEE